ncbi:hypothetical protein IWQ56_001959 [Coemansia nantahalensis]|nr:hypothetical protein IWQ56_001959 [Coemansia nantahalensis]
MADTGNGRSSATTDEFLQEYIAATKRKLEASPVGPNSAADLSVMIKDEETPKTWRRYYSNREVSEIVDQECVECEYRWRMCRANPPSFGQRISQCSELRKAYEACRERVRAEMREKSGKPLVDRAGAGPPAES